MMGHSHNHDHNHDSDSTTNLKVVFFLNLSFTVVELIGGIFTNSVAIIADSLHDFGDSLSLGLSWFLDNYSKKERSNKFSYGYKRFSLLSALINSTILVIGSIFVLYTSIPRFMNPETSNYKGMLLLAILGIIVNGIAVLRLKKGNSINEKVVSWHLLEDVFGWVAVLILSVVNMFVSLPILDPLLAIVFTLIIFSNAIKNLKPIVAIFLQSTPQNIDIKNVEEKIKKLKNVDSIHDMHLWTLDSENHVLTIHVVLKGKFTSEKILSTKCEIRKLVNDMYIKHVTVEIEEKNEKCGYKNC